MNYTDNSTKEKLTLGIVAHVDAGKTTLAEALLYLTGNLKAAGRVDHGDAFLDHFAMERERGITIFSKQALFSYEDMDITLLDTPGHVDFGTEMERTLSVLDAAILLISAPEGVQGHTKTLWRLLERYQVPTFLFVNKMDQPGMEKDAVLEKIRSQLSEACVDFSGVEEDAESSLVQVRQSAPAQEAAVQKTLAAETILENIAVCREDWMETYLETGSLSAEALAAAVAERALFPVLFGAALHMEGVADLLACIRTFVMLPTFEETFGARVFRITRDSAGNRLTHVKLTGGSLRTKQVLSGKSRTKRDALLVPSEGTEPEMQDFWEEKIEQIRFYNGETFVAAPEAYAGDVVALTGLTQTYVGQGLGNVKADLAPALEPVLTYRLSFLDSTSPFGAYQKLRVLAEEDPQLSLIWVEETKEMQAKVMGPIQMEILERQILERFGMVVRFDQGEIVYKETLAAPAVGIGHFEPLRHYAEVQLLLEPAELGSGISVDSLCSEDVLEKNWQRLIMTHLSEKIHRGVLMGAELTDVHISILAGRAHPKHTEGGDFRQATYRAVRQGLCMGSSVLLEPMYAFVLEIPTDQIGRAMLDIERMYGTVQAPEIDGDVATLSGTAPVATLREYAKEVSAYTRGKGRIRCTLSGYGPCHNTEEVLAKKRYDPEADLRNPTGSVFCAHGAGFVVPWEEVPAYAHVESGFDLEKWMAAKKDGADQSTAEAAETAFGTPGTAAGSYSASVSRPRSRDVSKAISLEEIDAILGGISNRSKADKQQYRRYHRASKRVEGGRGAGGSVGSSTGGAGQGQNQAPNRNATSGNYDKEYLKPILPGLKGAGALAKTDGKGKQQGPLQSYLLVDGYNIIFAWDALKALAAVNIDSARDRLMDICSNYQGYLGADNTLILVFDAYKVKGNPGRVQKYHNIYVVYTKTAETADQYIEKAARVLHKNYQVTVATSDALEQIIIYGAGAIRLSAQGFLEEVNRVGKAYLG